jgi:hypothetical protein
MSLTVGLSRAVGLVATVACLYAASHALPSAIPSASRTAPAAAAVHNPMAWATAASDMQCGAWPTASVDAKLAGLGVDTSSLGWQCADYRRREQLNARGLGLRPDELGPEACASWCAQRHPAVEAVEGEWCCQWALGQSGGECVWTDGMALLAHTPCSEGATGDSCAKPLAYEACSSAADFAPMRSPCKRGGRELLGARSASSLEGCSQLCRNESRCMLFAFSPRRALCASSEQGNTDAAAGRPVAAAERPCELYTRCAPPFGAAAPSSSFAFYGRSIPPTVGGMRQSDTVPPSAAGGLQFSPAAWPRQLGAPLGLSVDPRRPPARVGVEGGGAAKNRRTQPTAMLLGGMMLPGREERKCDASSGEMVCDVMQMGGAWGCAQLSLPSALLSAALRQPGMRRGECKQSGCDVFVAARTYAGVVFNVFNCSTHDMTY